MDETTIGRFRYYWRRYLVHFVLNFVSYIIYIQIFFFLFTTLATLFTKIYFKYSHIILCSYGDNLGLKYSVCEFMKAP